MGEAPHPGHGRQLTQDEQETRPSRENGPLNDLWNGETDPGSHTYADR